MFKNKFNIWNFQYGNKKRTLREWIQIGALIHLTLDMTSMIPGVEKRKVFNLLDEFQMHLNIKVLNDYIVQDSELVGYRVLRYVETAIKRYEEEMKKNET